jgi:hypothetical protein
MIRFSSPGHFPTISQIVSTYVTGDALLGKGDVDGESVVGVLLGRRRFVEVGYVLFCDALQSFPCDLKRLACRIF